MTRWRKSRSACVNQHFHISTAVMVPPQKIRGSCFDRHHLSLPADILPRGVGSRFWALSSEQRADVKRRRLLENMMISYNNQFCSPNSPLGLLNPSDEGTTTLRRIGKWLLVSAARRDIRRYLFRRRHFKKLMSRKYEVCVTDVLEIVGKFQPHYTSKKTNLRYEKCHGSVCHL
jgi:hypothetical protein